MDYTGDNYGRNKISNLLALLIESIYFYIHSLVRHYNHVFKRFVENFEIIEFFDSVNERLAGHTLLRFTVFTVAISCTIPVVMFILFGISSAIITFAGFVFIEGILLVIGGLCMLICMAMMILILSLLSVTLLALYVLLLKLANILNKFETTSHILRSITPASAQAHEILSLTASAYQE